MGYTEWSDRMAAAGYRTTISQARALLARLPEPEITRMIEDRDVWKAAQAAYKSAGAGKPGRWYDSPEALEMVTAVNDLYDVMIGHCRTHHTHYLAFLTALDRLEEKRAAKETTP